jgi:hypothetical protein
MRLARDKGAELATDEASGLSETSRRDHGEQSGALIEKQQPSGLQQAIQMSPMRWCESAGPIGR